MKAREIPLRLLPLRAAVSRYNEVTEEYDNVYIDVPCRLGIKSPSTHGGMEQDKVSSTVETPLLITRYYEIKDTPYNFRMEDRFTIGNEVYRCLNADNAESADHHFEINVQHVKTMNTSPLSGETSEI